MSAVAGKITRNGEMDAGRAQSSAEGGGRLGGRLDGRPGAWAGRASGGGFGGAYGGIHYRSDPSAARPVLGQPFRYVRSLEGRKYTLHK